MTNAPTYTVEDVLKEFRAFGRDSGKGTAALPRAALKCIQAAADGVFNLDRAKGEPDHAALAYGEYLEEHSAKSTFTKDGVASNAAKFRVFIKMGLMTTCDPMAVADTTVRVHKVLSDQVAAAKNKKDAPKIKSPFVAILDVAREQITSKVELTADEIEEIIRKPEPKEKTAQDLLKQAQDILESLITGDNNWGVKHPTTGVTQAHDLISAELATLVRADDLAELQRKAAELGLSFAPISEERFAA